MNELKAFEHYFKKFSSKSKQPISTLSILNLSIFSIFFQERKDFDEFFGKEGTEIGDEISKNLNEILKLNAKTLSSLTLSKNNIGDDGIAVLSDGIQICENLSKLNLSF